MTNEMQAAGTSNRNGICRAGNPIKMAFQYNELQLFYDRQKKWSDALKQYAPELSYRKIKKISS
ncbi:hypothetical protein MOD24_11840 [Bacillus haynesii]|uniref:hypothetical protein n=1 Tax=Bacillus haynesii TaxID=1925021 RepID=UPI002280752D|nr:hypothetical protein [Bacillus haynesii]MCY8576546.1 hypothetical protein [Bacillus haynesii]MCY8666259.1 hypothetical protein [Bacillus haynesii]